MDLCKHGDLRRFFEKDVPIKTKLEINQQIANGLGFLHSKNIVHRDMKPQNILVEEIIDGIPCIKIADFDLSRHIDTGFETHEMHSSFGTFAFRPPEFWKGRKGNRKYGTNVDVYATGLIFLAITQHKQPDHDADAPPEEKQSLILLPCLETYNDESEIYNPIGGTIYERQKYKIPPLSIVLETDDDDSVARNMKVLIRKMTEAEPSDRILIQKVIDDPKEIIKVNVNVIYSPK